MSPSSNFLVDGYVRNDGGDAVRNGIVDRPTSRTALVQCCLNDCFRTIQERELVMLRHMSKYVNAVLEPHALDLPYQHGVVLWETIVIG